MSLLAEPGGRRPDQGSGDRAGRRDQNVERPPQLSIGGDGVAARLLGGQVLGRGEEKAGLQERPYLVGKSAARVRISSSWAAAASLKMIAPMRADDRVQRREADVDQRRAGLLQDAEGVLHRRAHVGLHHGQELVVRHADPNPLQSAFERAA